ncbi:HET-domain-containing protein [Melanomma pulvis-pyrius CBS 109.77]|uniref:HET-domain-containing protein n=1 Tax=Melanomma pulvis-pyrius CBS 109.77 TaxID=1314802 RepID=A0A6A6XH60_9PLEO|nr:HET-domain-containing protein [Melanomma pulvis-pyrius CBS 109.77]
MELTGKLQEQYLWVDALCIIQDSDEIMQQTIRDMDRIYAQSVLTIVAATCLSANDSLPGVAGKRRWTQWYQKISPSLTLSAHFDFKDYMMCSKYNQRAWTFQEYHLATRLLIFASNGQVYFSCKEAVYSEEVTPGKHLEPDAAMLDGAQHMNLHLGQDRWSTYRQVVQEYTKRILTQPRDVLDAFSGISKNICRERFIDGLPVNMFDHALLWQPREYLQRREGFSSWSWAGWIGQVYFSDDWCLSDYREQHDIKRERIQGQFETQTWIVWHSSRGKHAKSPSYLHDGPPQLRDSASNAVAPGMCFPGRPQNVSPTPSLLLDALNRADSKLQQIRYLQFWTMSAYYGIEFDQSAVVRYSSFEPENTGNGLRRFHLRDTSGKNCGWVLLDKDWVDYSTKNMALQEFIMLSEVRFLSTGELKQQEVDPAETTEFNAMMITWNDGRAERAGLGRIKRDALACSCKRPMRWKEILLG